MSNDIEVAKEQRELAVNTTVFTDYLKQFGLPTDNIIATTEERIVVSQNLPTFLCALPEEEKRNARYLSKFTGATAIGLFDAALNYLWNEVVLNLRQKAIIYGIELFFDAAVGGQNRLNYKTEADLGGLKDSVLLDTCRKIEMISDVVYRKLDHILTMRNEVAASHPNVESIGGYELLGWLQTCVKDVLQDKPSNSAIQIRSLVNGLKAQTKIIDKTSIERISKELSNLSTTHIQNLLISMFGMFVSPETEQILKKNISLIAPHIWNCATENVKYKIGTQIDGYRTNLQNDRLEQGIKFLQIVDGRMYETLPAKSIALNALAEKLEDAHEGWDNFYTEPSIMREILGFCHKASDIPKEVFPKLANIVLRCRIGRGVSYLEGVSPNGKQLYNNFLSMLDDDGILYCISALFQPNINSKLSNNICQKHLISILNKFKRNAIAERIKEIIEYLLKNISKAYKANKIQEFRDLWSSFNSNFPL